MSQLLTRPIVKSDACDYCHAKKIRCDKRKPQCYECIKRNINCNYGTRLKRGPKPPKSKNKTAKRKQKSQIQNIQNVQKPSPYLQSMLFELEFNKKILEVWKNLSVEMADGKLRSPPKFDPATEEFIRSPDAAHTMMTEFDTTYRLIYSLHNYALSLDFADKLWQTIIDINTTDLFSVISSFETTILVSMLEYLVVFQLCTKIYMHDDMAAYLSQITRYILNIVIYARDGTNDSLTPELTLQLMMCITLISNYYKMVLDRKTVVAYHALIQDLFEQNKSSPLFRKEVEARMLCRKILDCSTPELTEQCLQRLDELDKQGIMSPNLHFHLNNHLAFHVLRKRGQISDADKAIQKAEYFINWHLRILPQDKRTAIQNFYMVRLFVVHSEVLFRMGNDESALQRIGQLYNTFAQLPTTLRRMTIANCLFFLLSMRTRGVFLTTNYLAVIANSGPAAYQLSFSTLALPALPTLDPRSNNNQQQCEPEDELDDIIEDSSSSPHNDMLTPGMYLLNDRTCDATFELASPSPNLYSQTCHYESSYTNVKIDEEIELDPFSYVDYYLA